MIKVSEIILVTRNARDKIQVAKVTLNQDANIFIIKRSTGQYLGKFTEQPELTIEKVKLKELLFNKQNLNTTV